MSSHSLRVCARTPFEPASPSQAARNLAAPVGTGRAAGPARTGPPALMAPSFARPPVAAVVHQEAAVVDLHNDVLLEAAAKRDITVRSSTGHSDLPRLREGGVDVQCFALFVHPKDAGLGFERVTELLGALDGLAAATQAVLGS